jgi:hypothetical protein
MTELKKRELACYGIFLVVFAILMTISLCTGGCAARQQTITALPTGVTQAQVQSWDTAVANLDKISQVTTTLRQAVIALNHANPPVIPDGPVYAAILTSLGKIDAAQIDAANFLKAQPNNWGVSTQVKVQNDIALIQNELTAIVSQELVNIKNPSAVSQIDALVSQISSAAAIIIALA